MKQTSPSPTAFRVADLSTKGATAFSLRPRAEMLADLTSELELLGLRKLSLVGDISPEGAADWRLSAVLGATVVQACAVTLAPVTTRIDVPVTRLYQKDFHEPDAPEAEMPEDDTVEPLGAWIDPDAVLREALVLNLPLYPRAEGAELGETVLTEPGKMPLRDEDTKPFAGLAMLRDQLSRSDDESGD